MLESAGSQYDQFYFSSLIDGNSYFSSLMFDIVLVCRRPSQLFGLQETAAQRRFHEAAEDVRARRHPAAATTLRAALS